MDDDENRRALEALRSSAAPVALAPARRLMAVCPHCREGFGSASLSIHVRRCRALLPPPESEVEAAASCSPAPAPAPARRPLPSLVDMCLRFVNKHFASLYLDRVTAFPEAEGALIASMPPNLVHRLIINLVNGTKKLKAKDHMHRAAVQKLQSTLDTAQRGCEQLKAARRAEASVRSRLGTIEQATEEMRRELDIAAREQAAVEAHNRDLAGQLDGFQKLQTRLEAKIQSLVSERDALKESVKTAQKREMEATKHLALASKKTLARTPLDRHGSGVKRHGAATSHRPHAASPSGHGSQTRRLGDTELLGEGRAQVYQLQLRKRPRSATSKIPLPRLLPDEYRRMLESEIEPGVAALLA